MSAGLPRPQTSDDPRDVQGVMHVPHTPQEPCNGFNLARSGLTVRAGFSSLQICRMLCVSRRDGIPEHDPEKWEPVFRKDHAQSKARNEPRDTAWLCRTTIQVCCR